MSDGANFAKPEPKLTPDQRIGEIERKYEAFRERIQAYDVIVNAFKDIKSHLESFQENAHVFSHSLEAENKALQNHVATHNSNVQEIKKSHEALSNKLSEGMSAHASLISQLENYIKSHYVEFTGLKNELSNVKAVIGAQLEAHEKHKERLASIQLQVQDLPAHVKEIQNDHERTKKAVQDLKTSVDQKTQELHEKINTIQDANEVGNKIRTGLLTELANKEKQIHEAVDKKIEQAKSIFNNPKSLIDEVEKRIMGKIESCALDAQNAFLKSSNNVQHMTLLEKKIENINLLIKKHELNK